MTDSCPCRVVVQCCVIHRAAWGVRVSNAQPSQEPVAREESCHVSENTHVTSKKDGSRRNRVHNRSQAHHSCSYVASSWSVKVLAYKMGHNKPGGGAHAPATGPQSFMLSPPKGVHGQ